MEAWIANGRRLDKIVADKYREVAAAKIRTPEEQLREVLSTAPPVRDFFAALDGRADRACKGNEFFHKFP